MAASSLMGSWRCFPRRYWSLDQLTTFVVVVVGQIIWLVNNVLFYKK